MQAGSNVSTVRCGVLKRRVTQTPKRLAQSYIASFSHFRTRTASQDMPPFFTRNLCVALTWDNARRVYGVRLRRFGAAIRVEACWSVETGEPADLGSRLAAGRNALGADETTTVVAGPAGLVVGVADLAMPKLGAAELRQALAFELARRAPVPPERLAWGWRVLPPDAATAGQRLRLGFLRETEWRRLLDDLAGMGAGAGGQSKSSDKKRV